MAIVGCDQHTSDVPASSTGSYLPAKVTVPTLDGYNAKLGPIMADLSQSFGEWAKNVQANQTKGLPAVAPAYEALAGKVTFNARALQDLTPPEEAKGVHAALLQTFDRLSENFAMTAESMKANDKAEVETLVKEGKRLQDETAAGVTAALKAGGFDEAAFRTKNALVKK